MKAVIVAHKWQIAFYGIVGAELIIGSFFGWRGLAGLSIGLGATWFNFWALWKIIGVLGEAMKDSLQPGRGTTLIVIAFLLKLPILIALGFFTRLIGGPALPCFVVGLGMVYCGLIGWACTRD